MTRILNTISACITVATWYILALMVGVYCGNAWAIARGGEIMELLRMAIPR